MTSKPPAVVDVRWAGDLRFSAAFPSTSTSQSASPILLLDSAGVAGPSPVSALVASLAACMSMDLAHILSRGRHAFRDIRAHLEGARSADDPHHLEHVTLHFTVVGEVPDVVIDRAIALSRERYCSVWHSLRQDIGLQVTFEIGA